MIFNTRDWFGTSFWLEALIFMIFPIPYYDCIITVYTINRAENGTIPVYYLLSDFILALMWIRCVFILRAVFNYTIFMDIYSKKLCKSFGFTANVRFAFKCLLTSSPGYTVCAVLIMSVLILAYLIRIFEMPYGQDYGLITWDSYFTAIWFIVITMTTTGFGDVFPSTTFGRLIAMFAAVWGTFLISILILSVGNIFKLNKNEQQAHSHLL